MEHAQRYLKRKYGAEQALFMMENNQISDLDQKVIQTMGKLKESYDNCNNNKVKTVMIAYQRLPIAPPPVSRAERKSKTEQKECRAIKMNGEKCKAKVKHDDFCARHSKKLSN